MPNKIDLSFTTDQWRRLVIKRKKKEKLLHHRYLELCVLSHVANELRSKDLFIVGADSYADYRTDLLGLDECEILLNKYCEETGIPSSGMECVKQLKEKLTIKAKSVDSSYPKNTALSIDKSGNPTLHKRNPKKRPGRAIWLEKILQSRMPKRNLVDVFCSSHFYSDWAHLGVPAR